MPNHNFTRPGGVWTPGTGLTAAELADLDAKTVDSISATGGVYALTEDLTIDGATGVYFIVARPTIHNHDVTFNGYLMAYEAAALYGDTLIGSGDTNTLEIDAVTTILQDVYFAGGGAIFDHVVLFNHDVTLGDNTACDITVNGVLQVNARATFSGTVDFESVVGFADDVTCEGDVAIGQDLSVGRDVVAGRDLSAGADIVAGRDLSTGRDVSVGRQLVANAGNCYLSDADHTVELNGHIDLYGIMRMPAAGAAIAFRTALGNDATATYSPLTVREVYYPDGILTASHTIFIDDTDCVDGMEFLVTNASTIAASVQIRSPSGVVVTGCFNGWARCVRVAGSWRMMQNAFFA